MPPTSHDHIIDAFKATHGNRYRLGAPLGSGAFGITFRAHDEARGIDVCVKLFKEASAPTGAKRDWLITSTLKHDRIGDTFTVERFPVPGLPDEATAVITRLYDGVDFQTFAERLFANGPDPVAAHVDDILDLLFWDLGTALHTCHQAGYGHGDLSERNVLVVPSSGEPRRAEDPPRDIKAIVIDFDNASSKPALRGRPEADLMESDVRGLVRLVGFLTMDFRWHEHYQRYLRSCRTPIEVYQALHFIRRVTGGVTGIASDSLPDEHWYELHPTIAAICLAGHGYATVTNDVIRSIAQELGKADVFDAAHEGFLARVRSGEAVKDDVVTRMDDGGRAKILQTIFL